MIRSREKGFTAPQRQELPHETSFRLFSVHGNSANSLDSDQYNSPNGYRMISSQATDKHKQLDRQPTYKLNNFCMPVQEEQKKVIGAG
jgi:hypothetical protein